MENKIIKLVPSDIISESMAKINHNFDVLSAATGMADFSLDEYKKKIEELLAELKNKVTGDNADIWAKLENLESKIYELYDYISNYDFGSGSGSGSGSGDGATTLTSFVFVVDNFGADFSTVKLTGGSLNNPYPNDTKLKGKDGNTRTYKWKDSPENVKTDSVVWMSKAIFKSNTSSPVLSWTTPSRMMDSSKFNVEWCVFNFDLEGFETAKNIICSNEYNFGNYVTNVRKNNPSGDYSKDIEPVAENTWRKAINSAFKQAGLVNEEDLTGNKDVFTDNPDKAYYMATASLVNGAWENWTFSDIAGEMGPAGESVKTEHAYAVTAPGVDLSNVQPTGGTYDLSIPTSPTEVDGVSITWVDRPENVNTGDAVWMTTGIFSSFRGQIKDWTKPISIADTETSNVEWCTLDLDAETVTELRDAFKTEEYNFGTFINKAKKDNPTKTYQELETIAEKEWRTKVKDIFTAETGESETKPVIFTDNPNEAYYMARTSFKNGAWTSWSLIKIGNEGESKFCSYVFTTEKVDSGHDLSKLIVSGGTYNKPIPDKTIVKWDSNGNIATLEEDDADSDLTIYEWLDSPENVSPDEVVWMTKSIFSSKNPEEYEWMSPIPMMDRSDFNVEWCETEIDNTDLDQVREQLRSEEYNFGKFVDEARQKYFNDNPSVTSYDADTYRSKIEPVAEAKWRESVKQNIKGENGTVLKLEFTDTPKKSYFMAQTNQTTTGGWTPWNLIDVKGEQGDPGTSISYQGSIKYTVYYIDINYSDKEYNLENSSSGIKIGLTDTTSYKKGDFSVIFKNKLTGDIVDANDIYVFIWDGSTWIYANYSNCADLGVVLTTGYALSCINNGHMIIWDGDSWRDLGKISGPEGASIHIKYGVVELDEDDTITYRVAEKDEIPTHIGIYTASPDDEKYDPNNLGLYKWYRFKGDDSFGYEYIYRATKTYDDVPDVPKIPSTETEKSKYEMNDYIPTGWSDDPMEVSKTNRYVWMCWRKRENGKWTDGFIGVLGKNKPGEGKAKLWANYSKETLTSFVFTTTNRILSSDYKIYGGNFSSPKPDATYLTKNGEDTLVSDVEWYDVPKTPSSGQNVWMTKYTFSNFEDYDGNTIWSTPQLMSDSSYFNVEWCGLDLSKYEFQKIIKPIVESDKLNFGNYLNETSWSKVAETTDDWNDLSDDDKYQKWENYAETQWRNAVKTNCRYSQDIFSDNPDKAYFMATATKNGGKWTNWTMVDVAGEDAEPAEEKYYTYAFALLDSVYYNKMIDIDLGSNKLHPRTDGKQLPPDFDITSDEIQIIDYDYIDEGDSEPSIITRSASYTTKCTWMDYPINAKKGVDIWMAKGEYSSKNGVTWEKPKLMMDTEGTNVEWCETKLSDEKYQEVVDMFTQNVFNFGNYLLSNNNDETKAEESFRADVKNSLDITFTDTPKSAYYMSVTKYNSSTKTWSPWSFIKIYGEGGTPGESYSRLYFRFSSSTHHYGTFTSASISDKNKDLPKITINYTYIDGTETISDSYTFNTPGYFSNSMKGTSSNRPVELLIERKGYTGHWGEWSSPIVINRYMDLSKTGGITEAQAEGILQSMVDNYKAEVEEAFGKLGVTDLGSETLLDEVQGKIFGSSDVNGSSLVSSINNLKVEVQEYYAKKDSIVSNSYFAKDKDGNLLASKKLSNVKENSLVYNAEKNTFTSIDDFLKYTGDTYYKDKDDTYKSTGKPKSSITLTKACDYLMVVTDQISGITQEVTANSATTALIASVADKGNGDITAGIFATANETGSGIALSADHILLDGDTVAKKLSAANATIDNIIIGESCIVQCPMMVDRIVAKQTVDNVEKSLNITVNEFEITRGGDGLSLYFATKDELSNKGITQIGSDKIESSVPVLKFTWKGNEYILDPSKFISLSNPIVVSKYLFNSCKVYTFDCTLADYVKILENDSTKNNILQKYISKIIDTIKKNQSYYKNIYYIYKEQDSIYGSSGSNSDFLIEQGRKYSASSGNYSYKLYPYYNTKNYNDIYNTVSDLMSDNSSYVYNGYVYNRTITIGSGYSIPLPTTCMCYPSGGVPNSTSSNGNYCYFENLFPDYDLLKRAAHCFSYTRNNTLKLSSGSIIFNATLTFAEFVSICNYNGRGNAKLYYPIIVLDDGTTCYTKEELDDWIYKNKKGYDIQTDVFKPVTNISDYNSSSNLYQFFDKLYISCSKKYN